MKKRLLTAMTAALMIGNILAGCSINADKTELLTANENENELGVQDQTIETIDEKSSGEPATQDPGADIAPQYTLTTTDYIYVIDEKGNKVSGFSKDDIVKAIGDDIKTEYYLRFAIAFDNIAICAYDEYGADEAKFYAYNCDTKEVVNFYNAKSYPSAVDYYNGQVLLSYSDVERAFTIGEDLSCTEDGPVNEDIYKTLADYKIERAQDRNNEGSSVTRALNENGYLLVSADDEASGTGYYMLKSDGSLTPLPQIKGERVTIADYNKDWIIYKTSRDWDFDGAYCLNTDTLEVSKLPWDEAKNSLGINNGKLYSCIDSNTDVYMIDMHDYYAYDMAIGEESKIFSTKSVPGSGYDLGRKGDFKTCGDNAFVLDVVGDKIKWLRVDYKDGEVSFDDIDCPVDERTPLKFGTVEYEGESYVCPKCGKLVGKSYQEYPVIDGSFSEHAEEINASLKELLTAQTAEDLFAPDDDHCDWHDYEEGLFDTHESLVWDMHIINDRFLTVEMTTYIMGVGSAHGYGTDYQLVYDLQTGKNLKNRDIFKGSEEEFKTFIAQKTKEYAENSDEEERKRFYSSDPDDIYNSAYENASFENTNLQYYDDHLELVYLQYEMGAYASGVFYIDISYEDFIGANTLTIE